MAEQETCLFVGGPVHMQQRNVDLSVECLAIPYKVETDRPAYFRRCFYHAHWFACPCGKRWRIFVAQPPKYF